MSKILQLQIDQTETTKPDSSPGFWAADIKHYSQRQTEFNSEIRSRLKMRTALRIFLISPLFLCISFIACYLLSLMVELPWEINTNSIDTKTKALLPFAPGSVLIFIWTIHKRNTYYLRVYLKCYWLLDQIIERCKVGDESELPYRNKEIQDELKLLKKDLRKAEALVIRHTEGFYTKVFSRFKRNPDDGD